MSKPWLTRTRLESVVWAGLWALVLGLACFANGYLLRSVVRYWVLELQQEQQNAQDR